MIIVSQSTGFSGVRNPTVPSLMAIGAHHLEVFFVLLVVERQHAQTAVGGPLPLKVFALRNGHLEGDIVGTDTNVFFVFIILPQATELGRCSPCRGGHQS